MTTLSKDEILAMAQEAGAIISPQWGVASNVGTATFERFATLCRADLVAENAALKQAHEINADTLNAMQVEIDDWKARAAAAEAELAREGEAVAKVVLTKTLGLPTMQWLGLDKQFDLADGQLLYTTPPQPAAQELDCATTGVCVRSGLYASPPSAVPVVEQLVEASTMLLSYTIACEGLLNAKPAGQIDIARDAIAAVRKFIKENGE